MQKEAAALQYSHSRDGYPTASVAATLLLPGRQQGRSPGIRDDFGNNRVKGLRASLAAPPQQGTKLHGGRLAQRVTLEISICASKTSNFPGQKKMKKARQEKARHAAM